MKEILEQAKLIARPLPMGIDEAYMHGDDCAGNGVNEKNCHFSIFSKPEYT